MENWIKTIGEAVLENKRRHGWRITTAGDFADPDRMLSELMLINTELAEAGEEVRENNLKLFGEELADVIIRTVGLAEGMGFDLKKLVEEKVERNKSRAYRHGGKRI